MEKEVRRKMCIRDRAYTVGRKYTFKYWKSLAKELEELGADSICIKDMAGLLMPYDADKLVKILCLLYTSRCV